MKNEKGKYIMKIMLFVLLIATVMVIPAEAQDRTIEIEFTEELNKLKRSIGASTAFLGVGIGLVGIGGVTVLTSQTLAATGLVPFQTTNTINTISNLSIGVGIIITIISFIAYEINTKNYLGSLEIQSKYWNLIRY